MSFGKAERIKIKVDKENITGRKNLIIKLVNILSKPSLIKT
jgi:hypothetical protein